jgi:chemotaxis signal transduction protein
MDSYAVVLDLGAGGHAAIAQHELVEVLIDFKLASVPLAPAYCNQLLDWRGLFIPIVDVARFLADSNQAYSPGRRNILALVAYRLKPGDPIHYGGLMVQDYPSVVAVSNDQFAELPPDRPAWRQIAVSCFCQDDTHYPIPSLSRLFSKELAERAPSHLAAP